MFFHMKRYVSSQAIFSKPGGARKPQLGTKNRLNAINEPEERSQQASTHIAEVPNLPILGFQTRKYVLLSLSRSSSC